VTLRAGLLKTGIGKGDLGPRGEEKKGGIKQLSGRENAFKGGT